LNGEVAGAVGVSGGSVEEDIVVATPAVELLQKMERWSGKIKALLPDLAVKPMDMEKVKEMLWHCLEQDRSLVPEGEIAALVGGICLALS
jgi:hypothetical protein